MRRSEVRWPSRRCLGVTHANIHGRHHLAVDAKAFRPWDDALGWKSDDVGPVLEGLGGQVPEQQAEVCAMKLSKPEVREAAGRCSSRPSTHPGHGGGTRSTFVGVFDLRQHFDGRDVFGGPLGVT